MNATVKKVGAEPPLKATHSYHYVKPIIGVMKPKVITIPPVKDRKRRIAANEPRPKPKKWTARELERVRKWREKGLTWSEIAAQMQLPLMTVWKECHEEDEKKAWGEEDVLEPTCPYGGKCFKCKAKDCTYSRDPRVSYEKPKPRLMTPEERAEHKRETNRIYRERNREAIRERQRLAYIRNAEKERARHLEYRRRKKEGLI